MWIASEVALIALIAVLFAWHYGEVRLLAFFAYCYAGNAVLIAINAAFPLAQNPFYETAWKVYNAGWTVGALFVLLGAFRRLQMRVEPGWWGISWIGASSVFLALRRPRVWSGSLELWELGFAVLSLALGILAVTGAVVAGVSDRKEPRDEWHLRIFAAYALLNAVCLFPASAYPHIGLAVSAASTACYAAWAWLFWRTR